MTSDPRPVLVWADTLLANGDPLGEFISLSYAQTNETDPTRFVERRRRLEELERQHARDWLGGIEVREAVWRWGLLLRAEVSPGDVARLIQSPAGARVEALAIRGSVPWRALAAAAALNELSLFTEEPAALTTLPRVARWRLVRTALDPSTELPATLERLALIETPVFPGLSDVLATRAPELTHLELASEHLEVTPLLHRLTRTSHPKLRSLVLGDDLTDDVLIALTEAPLLAQLDELEVRGPFTDAGLDAVLRSVARFSRIAQLRFFGGAASTGLKRLAHRQLPQLTFAPKPPPRSWTGW